MECATIKWQWSLAFTPSFHNCQSVTVSHRIDLHLRTTPLKYIDPDATHMHHMDDRLQLTTLNLYTPTMCYALRVKWWCLRLALFKTEDLHGNFWRWRTSPDRMREETKTHSWHWIICPTAQVCNPLKGLWLIHMLSFQFTEGTDKDHLVVLVQPIKFLVKLVGQAFGHIVHTVVNLKYYGHKIM